MSAALTAVLIFHTWACRRVLLERAPALAASVDVLGYGNTPWSRSAQPPFSSVDWNVAAIVAEALDIVARARRGEAVPVRRSGIRPELIVR